MEIEHQITKIKEAISTRNFSEVKKLLHDFLSVDLTDMERGEIYTQLTLLYIDTVNETNEVYRKSLELALAATKKLKDKEKGLNDEIKTIGVKRRLQEIDDLD